MKDNLVGASLEGLAREGQPLYYFVPTGNGGDALIHLGFHYLADRIGLTYTEIATPEAAPEGSTVIFGGGGGLATEWNLDRGMSQSPSAINITALMRRVDRLVIMPQSIHGYQSLLESLDRRVTLFLREEYSFEVARQHARGAKNVFLDHDTAFHIPARRFLNEYRGSRILAPTNVKDGIRLIAGDLLAKRSRFSGELNAMRVDGERGNALGRRPKIQDVSLVCNFGHATRARCEYTAFRFMNLLDKYQHIRTDRLHVAIGSALLGKRVSLYENSYFKCRAVYEYSLKDFNVELIRS